MFFDKWIKKNDKASDDKPQNSSDKEKLMQALREIDEESTVENKSLVNVSEDEDYGNEGTVNQTDEIIQDDEILNTQNNFDPEQNLSEPIISETGDNNTPLIDNEILNETNFVQQEQNIIPNAGNEQSENIPVNEEIVSAILEQNKDLESDDIISDDMLNALFEQDLKEQMSAFNEADFVDDFATPGFEDEEVESVENFDEIYEKIITENKEQLDFLTNLDSSSDDLSNLDRMIEEALEQDRINAAEKNIDDFLPEIVSDIAVYDTEEREEVLQALPDAFDFTEIHEQNQKNNRMLKIVAIGCAVLILILGVLAYLLIQQSIEKAEKGMIIEQTNTTGFLYVSMLEQLNNKSLELKKIIIDSAATVFYFNQHIYLNENTVTLTDNNDQEYSLDLSYLLLPQNSESPSQLRFAPLKSGVESFTLTIENMKTKDIAEFKIGADKKFQQNASKQISQPIKVLDNRKGLTIDITSAEFASSGSKIEFALGWSDYKSSLYLENSPFGDSIVLRDSRGIVLPVMPQPLQVNFGDHLTIGRADFEPVKSLTETVTVTFENLYRRYSIGTTLPLANIVNNIEGNEKIIDLGEFDLVLERLIKQGDKCVLVMHGREKANSTRVETKIEGQLVAVNTLGEAFTLDGTIRSSKMGTDILFNFAEANDVFKNANVYSLMLNIDSVLIKMPELSTSIDLSAINATTDLNDNPHPIESTFMQRLDYKAGKIKASEIKGLSPDILRTTMFNPFYRSDKLPNAKYQAQILASTIKNGQLLGIVAESFISDGSKQNNNFQRVHQIIAKPTGGTYTIETDDILY